MTNQEITLLNLGSSLDDIANIDPRGYGVCKLLYKASREYTGEPLCVNSAKKLVEVIRANDIVFIMTGFVLYPYKKAETDGVISSVLLARALVKAFDAKPVIICPSECEVAVKNLSLCVGLNLHNSIDELIKEPFSMGIITFTKDKEKANDFADSIIKKYVPKAVISIECPGANKNGFYHNARGIEVTELEAKQDVLFEKLRNRGVLNIAIGDLGNEIGMGAIGDYVKKHIPAECQCGCNGSIVAETKADNIITATVSDWGCYSMIAILAYLLEKSDVMHDAKLEKQAMLTAAESGLIDMTGEAIPAIDGLGTEITCTIVNLMKELVNSALSLKGKNAYWFDKITELKSFDK